MPLHNVRHLQEFLTTIAAAPNKTLSQNFLIDGNILQKIVTASAITEKDWVLEIGSGPGALTEQLLPKVRHLVAIEKDGAFAKALPRLEANPEKLRVLHADCLEVDLPELFAETLAALPGSTPGKVIANLPYHITTPILERLLSLHHCVDTLVLMVQKEVADRLCAQVDTRNYSSLTLFASFYSKVSYGFTVSRNCFYPKPNVDSAVVIFKLQPPMLAGVEEKLFFDLMHRAFQQRRKMMRASLKEFLSQLLDEKKIAVLWEGLLNEKILPTVRPETLTLPQWVFFTQLLQKLITT